MKWRCFQTQYRLCLYQILRETRHILEDDFEQPLARPRWTKYAGWDQADVQIIKGDQDIPVLVALLLPKPPKPVPEDWLLLWPKPKPVFDPNDILKVMGFVSSWPKVIKMLCSPSPSS